MNNYFLTFLNRGIFKNFLRLEFQFDFFKKIFPTILFLAKIFIPNPSVSNLLPRNIFSIIKKRGSFIKLISKFNE